jgi:hypothetical protein
LSWPSSFPSSASGLPSANELAYVDVVSSIGQTVGSAIARMLCSSCDVDISIGAGLEAQIGLGKLGLSLASPKKILYDKKKADPRIRAARRPESGRRRPSRA